MLHGFAFGLGLVAAFWFFANLEEVTAAIGYRAAALIGAVAVVSGLILFFGWINTTQWGTEMALAPFIAAFPIWDARKFARTPGRILLDYNAVLVLGAAVLGAVTDAMERKWVDTILLCVLAAVFFVCAVTMSGTHEKKSISDANALRHETGIAGAAPSDTEGERCMAA